jgi:hypothetical protein
MKDETSMPTVEPAAERRLSAADFHITQRLVPPGSSDCPNGTADTSRTAVGAAERRLRYAIRRRAIYNVRERASERESRCRGR